MERLRSLFLRFWPILFLLGIWFTFSYPYFFQQKVPFPSKFQVTFFSPWSYYQEFAGPVKNNAMPDIITQIYPWKYFTIQQLQSGEIAFWNPYSFAGTPHLANIQSTVLAPTNFLFLVLPFIDAWSLVVLLQPLVAGLFLYLYMREVGTSKTGSVISSIAFMFCGFIVAWMAYGTLAWAILFLPLILFAIERSFQKQTWIALPLITVGLAFSYFSGHIQTSLYLTLVSAAYLFYKMFATRDVKRFLFGLLFFVLGMSLSLLQILPTFELLQQSVRSNLLYQGGEIPLSYLITLFAPDFFGNPVTRNDWQGFYAERASFIGIIPLSLACFAFFRSRKSLVFFFTIVGILALGFSSTTPLRELLLVSNLPIFATSIPSRMIILVSFSLAVLSGFGFDNLQRLLQEQKKKKVFILFGILGIVFIAWCSLALISLPQDKISLAQKNILLPAFFFLVMMVVALLELFLKQFPFTKITLASIFAIVVLLLMTGDSLRFATKWMPFDDRSLVYPNLPVIEELKKQVGKDGRVFGSLGTQVESYYGISSIEGYDPLYIQRYGEFIRSASTGEFLSAERSVVKLDRGGKYTDRVLDLLGVTTIFHPKADTNQTWAFPVWKDKEKYTKVYDDQKFQLYRNNTALPRVKLFYQYEVIPDGKKLLKHFYTKDFDYRNILLLEEDPKISVTNEKRGRAKIIWNTPNKMLVSVETTSPALLFLSDAYYSQWKAKMNGKDIPLYRADYAFRAVAVERGKSIVEFYYNELF